MCAQILDQSIEAPSSIATLEQVHEVWPVASSGSQLEQAVALNLYNKPLRYWPRYLF
jgi:hypothetical protein